MRHANILLLVFFLVFSFACSIQLEIDKPYYSKLEKQNRDNPHWLLMRGKNELLDGNYKTARKFFRRALIFNHQLVEAYIGIGHSFREIGKINKALHYYQLALQIEPNSAPSLEAIGKAYLYLSNLDLALDYSLRSLNINPKSPTCLEQIGLITYAQGDYIKTLDYWKQSLDISPGNSQLLKLYNDLSNYVANYSD